VVVLDVYLVSRLDEGDFGAETFGVGDERAGFDSESFGFITGGDGTGGIGHDGDNGNRAVTELWAELLLDGGEVGVKVEEEPAEGRRIGLVRGHASIFVFYSLSWQELFLYG